MIDEELRKEVVKMSERTTQMLGLIETLSDQLTVVLGVVAELNERVLKVEVQNACIDQDLKLLMDSR